MRRLHVAPFEFISKYYYLVMADPLSVPEPVSVFIPDIIEKPAGTQGEADTFKHIICAADKGQADAVDGHFFIVVHVAVKGIAVNSGIGRIESSRIFDRRDMMI